MKPIVHAEIPQYDQQTQYVIELLPEEKDDHIFIGCEVKQMELEDNYEFRI